MKRPKLSTRKIAGGDYSTAGENKTGSAEKHELS